jgi:hypothetical protein
MGRRYRSDYGNWTPIYFLVMGRTSTGKEHIKKTVSAVMVAAKLDCLIGGSQYTSDEAVHNELREHATSIHVTDEFGIQLKAAKSAGSSHPQNVNRVFMELFSECDGFNRGKAFSTAGLNKNHREEFSAERRKLIKPSLTIVAITTPDIFYEEIGSASLCNGFLNRFIGMECHSPASKSVKKKVPAHDQVVPPEVVAWARKTRFGDTCDEEDAGNLVGLISDVPAYEEPTPWEMSFSESTEPLLDEIDEFCVDRLNDKTDPLGDMWGRTREQAMRLAMIIARSCNSTAIELEHLNWAVKFVKFWTSQMVKAASSNISDNAIDAAIKDVRRLLALAGPAGQSRTQLSNASRKYRALLPRQQSEIWSHLQIDSEHGVHERVGKRGPATKVLILTTLLEREDA